MSLNGANILITGGTGSFGRRFISTVTQRYDLERLIIYSREELKQLRMRQEFPVDRYPRLHMFIGDVRDRERLYHAMDGIDIVIHAAALKVVPVAEYNPLEAIKTNILGTANIVDAANDRRVSKVIRAQAELIGHEPAYQDDPRLMPGRVDRRNGEETDQRQAPARRRLVPRILGAIFHT